MKLKLLNEYGVPLSLQGCDYIKVVYPYENGTELEKVRVKVLEVDAGKIEVELTDFEIQGLKVGEGQTFRAEAVFADTTYHIVFAKALNVGLNKDMKVLI